jgi:hypothetical protein
MDFLAAVFAGFAAGLLAFLVAGLAEDLDTAFTDVDLGLAAAFACDAGCPPVTAGFFAVAAPCVLVALFFCGPVELELRVGFAISFSPCRGRGGRVL